MARTVSSRSSSGGSGGGDNHGTRSGGSSEVSPLLAAPGQHSIQRLDQRTSVAHHSPAVTLVGVVCAMVPLLGSYSFGFTMMLTSPIARTINGTVNGTVLMNNVTEGGLGITQAESDFFTSAACLGGMGGAFVGSFLLSAFGRRSSLILASLPFIAGSILQAEASSYSMLICGRLLTGIAIGVTSTSVPMYIAEVAPPRIRGTMGTAHQLCIVLGCLAGTAIGIPYGSKWRLMSWAALPCPCLLLLCCLFIPRSPRWLISKGNIEAARKALRRLRGNGEAEIEAELQDLQAAAEGSQSSSSSSWSSGGGKGSAKLGGSGGDLASAESSPMTVVLKTGALTSLLLVFQQLSGVGAVLFYGGAVFMQAGFKDANVSATLAQGLQFVFTVVAVVLVDKLGRKVLLIVSILIMLTSMSLLGLYFYALGHDSTINGGDGGAGLHTAHLEPGAAPLDAPGGEALASPPSLAGHRGLSKMPEEFALVFVFLFWIGFALGMGALPWLLMSELAPIRAAGVISSFATLVNWGTAAAVAEFFNTMIKAFGEAGTFWVFSSTLATALLFVIAFLPETKGQSLQDIERYFQGKLDLPSLSAFDLKLIGTVAVAMIAFVFGIVGKTFRVF